MNHRDIEIAQDINSIIDICLNKNNEFVFFEIDPNGQ
jgi:hypothetical protein